MPGKSLQNGVQNTAGLARLDHVGIEIVKNLGIFAKRTGESRATFNRPANSDQHLDKRLVLLLAGEDLKALNQGKAGINHDGKLAGEECQLFGAHLPPNFRFGDGDFAFHSDAGWYNLLPAKRRFKGFTARRRSHPADLGACRRHPSIFKLRHSSTSRFLAPPQPPRILAGNSPLSGLGHHDYLRLGLWEANCRDATPPSAPPRLIISWSSSTLLVRVKAAPRVISLCEYRE